MNSVLILNLLSGMLVAHFYTRLSNKYTNASSIGTMESKMQELIIYKLFYSEIGGLYS